MESTPEQRFWKKVDRRGPDECWEWKAAFCSGGYGHLRVNKRLISAHKFSYELHFGPLNGLFCLHKCDNPKCVNPAHLFTGTQAENIEDMREKGRVAHGKTHYLSKLTPNRIEAARLYRKNGWSFMKIAKRFNVSEPSLWRALNGRSWKSVS